MLDKEYLEEGRQLRDAMVGALVESGKLRDSEQEREVAKSWGLQKLALQVAAIPPSAHLHELPILAFSHLREGKALYLPLSSHAPFFRSKLHRWPHRG